MRSRLRMLVCALRRRRHLRRRPQLALQTAQLGLGLRQLVVRVQRGEPQHLCIRVPQTDPCGEWRRCGAGRTPVVASEHPSTRLVFPVTAPQPPDCGRVGVSTAPASQTKTLTLALTLTLTLTKRRRREDSALERGTKGARTSSTVSSSPASLNVVVVVVVEVGGAGAEPVHRQRVRAKVRARVRAKAKVRSRVRARVGLGLGLGLG